MEITCPSCSSKHRTEDYPGAFEIQCACGYSILVPDEASLQAPPDFDGAPMAQEYHFENAKVALAGDGDMNFIVNPGLMAAQAQDDDSVFSSLNLTAPEDLPEGMPYDSFELENQWKPETSNINLATAPQESSAVPETPKAVVAQDIVERIQMASIGSMHGALFDLSFELIGDNQIKVLSEHCSKFLEEKPWLRAHIDKGFEKPDSLIKNKKLSAVPELLAVEIYLHCAQNRIPCELSAHRF